MKIYFKMICCFLITALTSVAVCTLDTVQVGTVPVEMTSIAEPLLACNFYTESDFIRSVQTAVPYDIAAGRITGGIVPHHLLADSMIAPFFSAVSAVKPELVFLVGPNHKRIGNKKINTASWDWQTPFGVLEADDETVKRLVASCDADEDFDLMEEEHSISGLIPYVKYHMPDAKVVPVLLHGNLGLEGSKLLAGEIRKAAGDRRWIIIGSIDFSHYLPPATADKMDEITLKAIKTRDFESLNHMGNDNLDSPPTLMTVLEIMDEEGGNEMKLLDHSNSAAVTGTYSESTTSYFTMLFKEREAIEVFEGGNIQDAIDKAEDGSEIVLGAGTYTITQPLRIEGKNDITMKTDGDVRILGEYIDRQIIIIKDCSNITLENIRACHKSNEGTDDKKVFEKRSGSVVDMENCKKAVFVNCEFEGCGVYGIYAVNTPEVNITGCYIHHNSWKAFGFYGHNGSMNVTVKDCTITNNADFMEKDGTVNMKLEGSNVIKFNNKEGYNTR